MNLLKMDRHLTLNQAKDIVATALAKAEYHDLSIVISVGDRCGNDLVGATEVFGKPSVIRELYKEVAADMPPEEL